MTIYIALLRGINVGGNHLVKMADLKAMLEGAGLSRVQTYIQSGNAVFESNEDALDLQRKLEDAFERRFGFSASFMLRSADDFIRIIERCPYSFDALKDGQSIHVSLFHEPPAPDALSKLPDMAGEIDEYAVDGKQLYQLYRQSMLDSKLASQLQKVKLPATARNWRTIMKLEAMVRAAESAV